mgnify:CR=1 FL=1|jgi:glycosyltransferase involved in cell wall biosynthesis
MKVLQIASSDFFSTYGGGQIYVKNIVDEMISQHRDIVVISFLSNVQNSRYYKKSYKGIDLYELNECIGVSELQAIIYSIKPDVIHAHSHKAQISKIGQILHIPVVVTSHHGGIVCPVGTLMNCEDKICDVSVLHRNCLKCVLRNTRTGLLWCPLMRLIPRNAYIKLGKLLQRLPFVLLLTPIGSAALTIVRKQEEWETIVNGCDIMISPCYKLAEAMKRNGLPSEKTIVLPHGIPLPASIPPFPAITNGNIKFFYVGRICYVKGLHILAEAFHRTDAPNAELHIIGGAGNKAEQRYEKKLKSKYAKDHRIIWHGKVSPENVYMTISNYHISSSFSYLEAFGLNIAESLAMGKPVLATMNGGAEMQIEDGVNGWLIPQNNIGAMTDKMQEIISDFKKYNVRLSTSKVISIENHCLKLFDIYSNLVQANIGK